MIKTLDGYVPETIQEARTILDGGQDLWKPAGDDSHFLRKVEDGYVWGADSNIGETIIDRYDSFAALADDRLRWTKGSDSISVFNQWYVTEEAGNGMNTEAEYCFTEAELRDLLDQTIGLFQEWRDKHDKTEEYAKGQAVQDMIEGQDSIEYLRSIGEL